MHRLLPLTIVLFVLLSLSLSAQQTDPAITPADIQPSTDAVIAMTRADYPVTPGDVYRLSYLTSVTRVEQQLVVDGDHRINLGFLGTIDGRGVTYREASDRIIQAVRNTYPNSFPNVMITSVGRYEVYLAGQVQRTGYVRANGLSRLSNVAHSAMLPASSVRRVTVVRDGRRMAYDLFLAERFGRRDQDPYLRPGDTVEISRADRVVRVAGEVRRPGTYELLPGEQLTALIERYADGFTEEAAAQHMYLNRGDEGETPRRIRTDTPEAARLQNNDQVIVPSRRDFLPAVSFQGAVIVDPEAEAEEPGAPLRQQRFTYRFVQGETLRQAVRGIQSRISPHADLTRVEYFRTGTKEPVSVDVQTLLYAYRPELDVELEPGDRIVIPFGTFEIFITGEVTRAQFVNVESLTRLSGAIAPRLTPYSSRRDVRVTTPGGTTATYDLFLAERFGRRDQNPYLRPGDTVEISRADRIVVLEGEVRRSGTYQLLPGDELRELVDYYGDGLTPDADPSQIRITRTLTQHPAGRELFEISYTNAQTATLFDEDRILVRSESLELPFVHLEGAIVPERLAEGEGMGYTERRVQIVPGQSLRGFVRDRRSLFQPAADLGSARLLRADGTAVDIDLASLLYSASSPPAPVDLLPGDRIIVPFRNPVVVVSGAVARSGTYAYVPDRSVDYYVNLAGGYDATRTWFRAPRVISRDGERLDRRGPVPPEATIVVPANNLMYVAQIGTVVSAISGVLSLALLLGR